MCDGPCWAETGWDNNATHKAHGIQRRKWRTMVNLRLERGRTSDQLRELGLPACRIYEIQRGMLRCQTWGVFGKVTKRCGVSVTVSWSLGTRRHQSASARVTWCDTDTCGGWLRVWNTTQYRSVKRTRSAIFSFGASVRRSK